MDGGGGVRQRCPLSPLLFNIVTADLEEDMTRGRWSGVRLGETKIYSMAYADDMVLLTKEEDEMRTMLARMERYIDKKRLEVNVKTKIMIFSRGKGRRKRVKWMWEGKEIEKMKEIKYLGYVFQSNGRQKGHIKDKVRKVMEIMGQVWSIGKRKFGKDVGKRIWLFDAFGCGIKLRSRNLGKEREEMEKVKERFLNGLDIFGAVM